MVTLHRNGARSPLTSPRLRGDVGFTRHAKNPGEGTLHNLARGEPPSPQPTLRSGFDLSPHAGRTRGEVNRSRLN
jgi:hypothetical protein